MLLKNKKQSCGVCVCVLSLSPAATHHVAHCLVGRDLVGSEADLSSARYPLALRHEGGHRSALPGQQGAAEVARGERASRPGRRTRDFVVN